MTYSAGNTILDDDYNLFAQGSVDGSTRSTSVINVNRIWATQTVWGSADAADQKGYGQNSPLAAVSAGATVTATQWTNMLNKISTMANHQGSTITAITNPSAGDTIEAYTALATNLTTVWNNRNNATANGTDDTTTEVTTSTWSTRAYCNFRITFSSTASLHYLLNAGGHLRLSLSLTGGSDAKSAEWADLLTKLGTIVITGAGTSKTINGETLTGVTKIGGGGTPSVISTSQGVYDLTASPAVCIKQYADSAPYTANYVQITASWNATALNILFDLYDDAADTVAPDGSGSGDALDIVDGTLTATATWRPPSTTYLSNASWGSAPTTSFTTAWTLS